MSMNIISCIKVLHFTINNINVCIDLQHVNKILPLTYLENVPECPNYLAGLLNIRGKSTPVIDLRIRLNMTSDNLYTLETPIILCTDGKHEMGIIVDSILNVSEIESNRLQMQDKFKQENSIFAGIIMVKDTQSLLLNTENLIGTSINFHLEDLCHYPS